MDTKKSSIRFKNQEQTNFCIQKFFSHFVQLQDVELI